MSQQIINREVISNKSDYDQNILIAGRPLEVDANSVAIVEIELLAYDLHLHDESSFLIQNELWVTFDETPDGCFTAYIDIPISMQPTPTPTDLIAGLNQIMPAQAAAIADPTDTSTVGYWGSGKATGMVVPIMVVHHVYKSKVAKNLKKAKEAAEKDGIAKDKANAEKLKNETSKDAADTEATKISKNVTEESNKLQQESTELNQQSALYNKDPVGTVEQGGSSSGSEYGANTSGNDISKADGNKSATTESKDGVKLDENGNPIEPTNTPSIAEKDLTELDSNPIVKTVVDNPELEALP